MYNFVLSVDNKIQLYRRHDFVLSKLLLKQKLFTNLLGSFSNEISLEIEAGSRHMTYYAIILGLGIKRNIWWLMPLFLNFISQIGIETSTFIYSNFCLGVAW
jgi:hypothetical protein